MGKNKDKFYKVYKIEKSLRHHIIEWLAAMLSVTGSLMIAFQNRNGFYIWIVANLFWISFSWKHKHYGLLALSISYLLINVFGLIRWKIA